ncbi:MAG TPA: hypothetical protein VM759_12930, partial [Longimicrobium sp.]|nr:hypothetical protein [Longimicrobium sp.]
FWIETPPLYPGLGAAAIPGFGASHRGLMEALPHLGPMVVLVRDGADRSMSQGDVTVDRTGRPRIRYRLGRPERARLLRGMDAAARMHFAAGAEEGVHPAHPRLPPALPRGAQVHGPASQRP